MRGLGGAEGARRPRSVGFSTEHDTGATSPSCSHFCICWMTRCWQGLGDEGDSSSGAKGHVKITPAVGHVLLTQPEGPARAKERLEQSWLPRRAG